MVTIFLIFLLLQFPWDAAGGEISAIKTQDRGDYIRYIFELDRKPHYFVYQLGDKIYIRLENTKLAAAGIEIKNGAAESIETAENMVNRVKKVKNESIREEFRSDGAGGKGDIDVNKNINTNKDIKSDNSAAIAAIDAANVEVNIENISSDNEKIDTLIRSILSPQNSEHADEENMADSNASDGNVTNVNDTIGDITNTNGRAVVNNLDIGKIPNLKNNSVNNFVNNLKNGEKMVMESVDSAILSVLTEKISKIYDTDGISNDGISNGIRNSNNFDNSSNFSDITQLLNSLILGDGNGRSNGTAADKNEARDSTEESEAEVNATPPPGQVRGIANLTLKTMDSAIEYTLLTKNNSLKRYLYLEPDRNNKHYRVVVDVYREEQPFENLDNFLSVGMGAAGGIRSDDNNGKYYGGYRGGSKGKQKSGGEKSLNDLLAEIDADAAGNGNGANAHINSNVTLDDLIRDNIKPENLEELIALNNIIDDKVAQDLERQNNEGINLDDFLQQLVDSPMEKSRDKIEKNRKDDGKTGKLISAREGGGRNFFGKKRGRYLVVVDAGHGGVDSGAVGIGGTLEKNINLRYSLEIARQLEKMGNFDVYLTRDRDRFISLRNRIVAARKLKPDLFLSIHSDFNPDRRSRGLSLYTLLKKNGRSNSGYGRNIFGHRRQNADGGWDSKHAKSNRFVNILLGEISRQNINTLYNPHKYARFAVLLAPEYPSVLIELGFLSNEYDERMLNSSAYREKIAVAIGRSVKNYFNN